MNPVHSDRIAAAQKRHGDYYANRLALFLQELPSLKPGGVVFLGDSITEQLPTTKAFPDENVINRGIGGDMIEGVLDRIDVCIQAAAPRRVYLLIGTNHALFRDSQTTEEFISDYTKLIQAIRKAAPRGEIIIQSIPPLGGDYAQRMPKVHELNARIKELAQNEKLPYVDLHPALSDAAGLLRPEFTPDGVHLNLEGNLAWLERLLPPSEYRAAAQSLSPR